MLKRVTFIPALTSSVKTSTLSVAGPIVQIIFVFLSKITPPAYVLIIPVGAARWIV
jgi:hypothetical protein